MNRDQFHDLQFARPAGALDAHLIANLLAKQPASNRRAGRNHTFGDVNILAGYQLVLDLFVLGDVQDHDTRAEPDAVVGDGGHIHHGKGTQPSAQLIETRVDVTLTLVSI